VVNCSIGVDVAMCYQGCSGCGQCVVGRLKTAGLEGGCPVCGHKNKDDAVVCEKCGTPIIAPPGTDGGGK
jgi:DNA-directed RNA polymerase subunit RPC12/RpoP